jgi:chloramphenicol 3-O-phosphotransferase
VTDPTGRRTTSDSHRFPRNTALTRPGDSPTASASSRHPRASVLAAYLAAGYDEVLLSWVLHRQDIVDRLLLRLGQPSHLHVALVCGPDELMDRRRSRGEDQRHDVALERLQQIHATGAQLVDTSGCSPDQVADSLQALLQ